VELDICVWGGGEGREIQKKKKIVGQKLNFIGIL
jgi:hypothetical protein